MYEDDVDLDHNGGDGGHLLSVEPIVHVDHVGDDDDGDVIECMRMMMMMMVTF